MDRRTSDALRAKIIDYEAQLATYRQKGDQALELFAARELKRLHGQLAAAKSPEQFGRRVTDIQAVAPELSTRLPSGRS